MNLNPSAGAKTHEFPGLLNNIFLCDVLGIVLVTSYNFSLNIW